MQLPGSWPLFPVFLLSCLLHFHASLAFSLKNCTIIYHENASNLSVTCSQRDLTAVPDDIPRNATSLELSSNQISKITGTDLRCLSKLVSLQADYNSISHIDDGAFADLVELRDLNMENNQLTNLTDSTFKGLSKLVRLSLDGNQISSISSQAFQSLVNIKSIHLDYNQIQQVADIAPIFQLSSLQYLFLAYNHLTSFLSDDLPLNVSNLKSLDLTLNPLLKFSITEDVFPQLEILNLCGCSSMEWDVANKTFLRSLTVLALAGGDGSLELYRSVLQTTDSLQDLRVYLMKTLIDKGLIDIACQIHSLRVLVVSVSDVVTIDNNLLRSCSQVTELDFSNNILSELSEHSFRSMTQLWRLALNNNHLSKLQLALQRLSTLEILDLSSNLITEFDCHDFHNLTKLVELNLQNNYILKLEGCVFQNMNNLRILKIAENFIVTFDSAFKVAFHKLESLNLHNNRLFGLMQGDFTNLSSLCFLDLETDALYPVHDGVFDGLSNLQTLGLTLGNYRKEILTGLPQLETLILHLTSNWNHEGSQENDEPPFINLPNLRKLVLKVYDTHDRDIEPDLLKGLKSLEYFRVENSQITFLHPDTFTYTPQLKGLQIINSYLSDLKPELFWPVPHLQELDLSNNNLRSLDFLARANLTVLSWLKVSDNVLSVINETVFQSLPALIYLDLTANPLTCECSNAGFNQWVQSNNQTQVVNGHQYTCAFPVSQQGKKFLDFDTSYCWTDTAFLCFISSTCVTVFTLLTSFIYHFLRWHLVYSYYLFLAFLYDKKRRNQGAPHRYDAFVSYNIHDEAFVYRKMLPVLEGEQGWRLCLHHRDFEPGKPIVENITDAIYGSRKTICVISRHYLQSEWCSREIQMASYRLFDEQEDVLILLFMEDIPAHQLSPYYQMRSLVRRRTYLSWQQAGQHTGVFWQKVQQALDTTERQAEHRHLVTGRPNLV